MSKTYYLIRYFWVAFAGFDDSLRLFVPHAQGERGKNDGDLPAHPMHSLRSRGTLGAGSFNLSAAGVACPMSAASVLGTTSYNL